MKKILAELLDGRKQEVDFRKQAAKKFASNSNRSVSQGIFRLTSGYPERFDFAIQIESIKYCDGQLCRLFRLSKFFLQIFIVFVDVDK